MYAKGKITQLLGDYASGDPKALNDLVSKVYDELHKMARGYMRKEKSNHTLQPTALLNELFVKLVQGKTVNFQNRSHFFAVSANIMRRVLIDHAKANRAEKRGGGGLKVTFDEAVHAGKSNEPNLEVLDVLLDKLAKENERQAQIVELRYFAGFSIEETAAALEISPTSVKRDWAAAKLWLYRELHKQ